MMHHFPPAEPSPLLPSLPPQKKFWDLPGFTKNLSAEQLATKRFAELKSGRLAMIGMASLIAASVIPGSVPLLAGAPALTGPGFVLPFGTF
jgi:hypothetical protein